MSEEPVRLRTPLTREGNGSLSTGDVVLLSGVLFAARDAAHARIKDAIENGEPLPFDPEGQVVYFTGPAPARP
ncbi:MAG: fumarate hydratase C-terminal domain-containing protein, partial [Actinomycetota bacterium]|nr:fumarate hydratase C-terminal domain-containing protein [Actinomycetota bacterium]